MVNDFPNYFLFKMLRNCVLNYLVDSMKGNFAIIATQHSVDGLSVDTESAAARGEQIYQNHSSCEVVTFIIKICGEMNK